MKKEELLNKLTDKQREYDWGSLPDSFSYSQKLSYICHKKDELDREHGIQYITLGKILRGDGCPKCNGKGMDKELFVRKANIVHNYFYKYDNFEYVNKKTKGLIYCPTHKLYFNQSPEKHLMGHGCPKCRYEKSAKSKTKTTEMFITQAKELFGDIYDYHKTLYERDNKKVCIICPKHGEFWQTPSNHLQGQGCPKCGRDRTSISSRITFEDFVEYANKIHGNKYRYIKDSYTKASDNVSIICPIHGIFVQKGTNHTCLHQGCPKCSNQQSLDENEIYHFIKDELCITDALQRVRNIIHPYELDIYIPSKKIAIEYNGLIWHSEKFKGKVFNYHLNKTENCEKISIRLIHIFEDEWNEKKEIIKSNLKAILNKDDIILHADDCTIKNTDIRLSEEFLSLNHLQGNCRSKYKYGLYYKEELVSLMTFSRHKDDIYEIKRYCNKKNYKIIDSDEKLLTYFINKIKPKSVICNVDRIWSEDDFLKNFGFIHINDTKPDYTYVTGDGHKRYRKSDIGKVKPSSKLYRLYDCGKRCYKLEL